MTTTENRPEPAPAAEEPATKEHDVISLAEDSSVGENDNTPPSEEDKSVAGDEEKPTAVEDEKADAAKSEEAADTNTKESTKKEDKPKPKEKAKPKKKQKKSKKKQVESSSDEDSSGSSSDSDSDSESEEDKKKKKEEEDKGPMKVEVKYLENRVNAEGYNELIEAGAAPPKANSTKYDNFALTVTNFFDRKGKIYQTQLDVKSPHLKKMLRKLVDNYPGISFETQSITVAYPLHVFFHYRNEIQEFEFKEGDELTDNVEEANGHLNLFRKWLVDELKDYVQEYDNIVPKQLISFTLLWAILKPGCTVVCEHFGEMRALHFLSGSYNVQRKCYAGQCEYIEYDGNSFGKSRMDLEVPMFGGTAEIKDLEFYPLSFHPKEKELKERLIKRGKKFSEFQGHDYREYGAQALGWTDLGHTVIRSRQTVNGRVMVDAATFGRINPNRVPTLTNSRGGGTGENNWQDDDEYDSERDYSSDCDSDCDGDHERRRKDDGIGSGSSKKKRVKTLTEDEQLISSPFVPGFAFREKMWLEFFVDKLKPIQWNDDAFDKLVLPDEHKDLIKTLVENHLNGDARFDDVIKGKGKGLIAILHGPPGVGKTLTAESVADHVRSPLYSVTAGEIGTTPRELEASLSKILDIAATWKAVTLIDEADIFLEQRSLLDIHRNALVSIFLRLLEYYEGILFLTTNRVRTFDEAFQSRIHVALRYRELGVPSRKQVWKNFIDSLARFHIEPCKLSDAELTKLARRPLNGRQIKNAVRTAQSLADQKKEKMGSKHLEQVLCLAEAFEEDLGGAAGQNYKHSYV